LGEFPIKDLKNQKLAQIRVPFRRSTPLYTLGGKTQISTGIWAIGAANLITVKVSLALLTIVKIGYLTTKQLW
jgi:hypothetical protein